MPPALIVGLGNPGPEYEGTRHNVGFEVVTRIAAQVDARLRPAKGIPALVAEAHDGDKPILLVQPTTFMNLSGEAVASCMRYYRARIEDVVIVHDDVDLPFGDLRVKRGGGDAGHNGLKHITHALRSKEYARIRLGIGRPQGRKDVADFVLGRFDAKEREDASVLVARAADATMSVVRVGVEATHRDLTGEFPGAKSRRLQIRARVEATPDALAEAFAVPAGFSVREEDLPRRVGLVCDTTPEPTPAHVRFKRAGAGSTIVEVTHSGWGDGREWTDARETVEAVWKSWLASLAGPGAPGPERP